MKNDLLPSQLVPFITQAVDPVIIQNREPLKIVVLLDTSASIADEKKKALRLFSDILLEIPQNSVRAYARFSNRMHVLKRPEASEPDQLNKIMKEQKFSGSTAYFDSIYYSLDLFDKGVKLGKKLLVVISDGIDEVNIDSSQLMSVYSHGDCVTKALEKDVSIISVPVGSDRMSSYNINTVAEETGGKVVKDRKSFKEMIEKRLRERFTVILEDPFLENRINTREVNISANYKGDTLNINTIVNMKKNTRIFPENIYSTYKEYEIRLEDVIVDSPQIILTAYAYRYGSNISGPKEEDLKVSVRSQVDPYRYEKGFDDHNVIILLDKSGSMKKYWDDYMEFIPSINLKKMEHEKTLLYYFDSDIGKVSGNDVAPFVLSRSISPEGSTALYDSLFKVLFESLHLDGQKSIILLSDGNDQRYERDKAPMSKKDLRDVKWALKDTKIPLYSITFDINARHRVLRQMAIYSGGKYFFSPTEKSQDELLNSIRKSLSGYYNTTFNYPGLIMEKTKVLVEVVCIINGNAIDRDSVLFIIVPDDH